MGGGGGGGGGWRESDEGQKEGRKEGRIFKRQMSRIYQQAGIIWDIRGG